MKNRDVLRYKMKNHLKQTKEREQITDWDTYIRPTALNLMISMANVHITGPKQKTHPTAQRHQSSYTRLTIPLKSGV